MAFVEMVARCDHFRIMLAQPEREIRIALQADARRCGADRLREHAPGDLDHRDILTEWIGLDRTRQGQAVTEGVRKLVQARYRAAGFSILTWTTGKATSKSTKTTSAETQPRILAKTDTTTAMTATATDGTQHAIATVVRWLRRSGFGVWECAKVCFSGASGAR
jgi:hypothetical protein